MCVKENSEKKAINKTKKKQRNVVFGDCEFNILKKHQSFIYQCRYRVVKITGASGIDLNNNLKEISDWGLPMENELQS